MLKHENPSRNPPRPKNRYQKDDSKRRAVRGYPRGKEASRSENRNKQRTHSHAQTIDSSDTERRNDLGNGEQSQDSDHVRVSIMRERKDNIVEPTGEQRGHAQTRNGKPFTSHLVYLVHCMQYQSYIEVSLCERQRHSTYQSTCLFLLLMDGRFQPTRQLTPQR